VDARLVTVRTGLTPAGYSAATRATESRVLSTTSFALPPSALNVDVVVVVFWYGVSTVSGKGTHTRVGPEGSSTSARVTISNVRQPPSGEED
jgi:hypothetical protein